MTLHPIFALPGASQASLSTRSIAARKRKRSSPNVQSESTLDHHDDTSLRDDRSRSIEYTAVVTPAERSQRRLAGLPVDQAPPPFPFPHAAPPSRISIDQYGPSKSKGEEQKLQGHNQNVSLHTQHIAAMTALLHRCMMAKDYARAGRALGLLLRTEVGGRAVDIRSQGLWGAGAEILLGRDTTLNQAGAPSAGPKVTREGFERAKLYYERLIVQYPQHKTWPDAINALDFCTAMFGLWIYVTDQESRQLLEKISPADSVLALADGAALSLLEIRQWELEQSKQIAEAMDIRLRSVPYNGNSELNRLRAMVAAWTADLLDTCADLEGDNAMQRYSPRQRESSGISDTIERVAVNPKQISTTQPFIDEAAANRDLARALLNKLQDTHDRNHAYD